MFAEQVMNLVELQRIWSRNSS